MENLTRNVKRFVTVALLFCTFSGGALADSIIYDDFYGAARYSTIEGALVTARNNALSEAFRLGYSNCTFVGYQSRRPNFYDPNWYEVTAAYTCQKWVRSP